MDEYPIYPLVRSIVALLSKVLWRLELEASEGEKKKKFQKQKRPDGEERNEKKVRK